MLAEQMMSVTIVEASLSSPAAFSFLAISFAPRAPSPKGAQRPVAEYTAPVFVVASVPSASTLVVELFLVLG